MPSLLKRAYPPFITSFLEGCTVPDIPSGTTNGVTEENTVGGAEAEGGMVFGCGDRRPISERLEMFGLASERIR
jgi:hypothetical protein